MDMTPAQLCEVLRDRLAREVAPKLTDDHAQSQLQAAIDVLGKIAPLLDWSAAMLDEQAEALERGLDAVAEAARDVPGTPPRGPAPAPDGAPDGAAARLEARRQETAAWLDWLHGPGRALAPERRDAIDRLLRDALQGMLAAERRRIAAIDFSSMTRG